jgi:hypothetical protein
MAYKPHRLEPNYPGPEVVKSKSPAPPVVVECWCLMVATMDRVRLDKFTRETWKKFDAKGFEALKWISFAGGACWRCSRRFATTIDRAISRTTSEIGNLVAGTARPRGARRACQCGRQVSSQLNRTTPYDR